MFFLDVYLPILALIFSTIITTNNNTTGTKTKTIIHFPVKNEDTVEHIIAIQSVIKKEI